MFLRRQDVLDQFDKNFRQTEDGQILFQPRRTKVGLPITSDEYEAVTAVFERRQLIDMAMTWIAILSGAGFGYYHLLADNSWSTFFGAFAAGFFVAIMISLRGQLDVLRPLIRARDELQKAMSKEQLSGEHSR